MKVSVTPTITVKLDGASTKEIDAFLQFQRDRNIYSMPGGNMLGPGRYHATFHQIDAQEIMDFLGYEEPDDEQ